MIDIALDTGFTEKQNCCGCTACDAVYLKNCIEIREDAEGFLYPFVDKGSCVNCHACERVCPVLNAKEEVPVRQDILCRIKMRLCFAKARSAVRLPSSQNM